MISKNRVCHIESLFTYHIGFGFLFLGLDYMKGSVESFAQAFSLDRVPDYGLWFYLLVGILITAAMQASDANIAIVLTALNSRLIQRCFRASARSSPSRS